MLSNQFWHGFILGALLVLGAFLVVNLLVRARAKK
jgi:hypothetical protein